MKAILTGQSSSGSKPVSINISNNPDTTIFLTGSTFNPAGMEVQVTYADGNVLTASGWAYSPSGALSEDDTTITVFYTESGVTVSTTLSIIVSDWTWGDEEEDADADWFAGLSNFLAEYGSLEEWIGKTKSITLTEEVLGTTTHLIRCVDVDNELDNSVTFQTANCLNTAVVFSSSSADWSSSTLLSTYCANYYNAFPYPDYIQTVSKETATSASVTQVIDHTIFLPSEYEMMGSINATTGAYQKEGTYGRETSSYTYYTNNSSRKKTITDSGTGNGYYWTRSASVYGVKYVVTINTTGGSTYRVCTNSTATYFAPAFVIQ